MVSNQQSICTYTFKRPPFSLLYFFCLFFVFYMYTTVSQQRKKSIEFLFDTFKTINKQFHRIIFPLQCLLYIFERGHWWRLCITIKKKLEEVNPSNWKNSNKITNLLVILETLVSFGQQQREWQRNGGQIEPMSILKILCYFSMLRSLVQFFIEFDGSIKSHSKDALLFSMTQPYFHSFHLCVSLFLCVRSFLFVFFLLLLLLLFSYLFRLNSLALVQGENKSKVIFS